MKSSATFRLPATGLALILAARASAEGITSAHWRTTVTVEGARPGQSLQEAEVWLAGTNLRVEERTKGKPTTDVWELDGQVYVWVEGEPTGSKMAAGLALRSGRPSHAFVRQTAEIRAHGRKIGTESVDGRPCEIFEYEGPQGKGTFWLAPKLQDFPVRAVLERNLLPDYHSAAARTVKLEYRNTDVRIPAERVEAKMALPPGVQFQDLTELMFLGRARSR